MSWMTDEQIDWLLEGTAEMMEHPEVAGDLQVTPELALALDEYEAALERSLRACLTRLGSTAPSELTDELMGNGEAPLNVLNTLRGEGVGIWDGRWDEYFQSEEQIEELQRCLERDLRRFADDTGGGSLNDALMNAVFDAVGEDLTPNERMRLSVKGGRAQARRAAEAHGAKVERMRSRRRPGGATFMDADMDFDAATRWYGEAPGQPPFPPGTLLHFSQLSEGQMLRNAEAHWNEQGAQTPNARRPRGAYHQSAAKAGDYVFWRREDNGLYYAERVGAGGTSSWVGSAVGEREEHEILHRIEEDAHVHGRKNVSVFEQQGHKGLVLVGHLVNGRWQRLGGQTPNARGGEVDEDAVDELLLWIDNTAELSPHSSRGQGHSIVVNLLRKMRKGAFDERRSVKAWEYLADAGAKDYARQAGDRRPWHVQFSTATRRAAAKSLAERFVSDAKGGEYEHVDLSIRR